MLNKNMITSIMKLSLGCVLFIGFVANSFAGDTGFLTAVVYLPVEPSEPMVFEVDNRAHQCMWSPRSQVSEVQHAEIIATKKGINISQVKLFVEPKNSSSDGDLCNTEQNLADYSIHGVGNASSYSAGGSLRWHTPSFSHNYISLENSNALQICGRPDLCGAKEIHTPSSHGDSYIIFTPMGG
ncbi:MAG: hypothetical protein LW807_01455 [Proteobacteria bacterium]|jgi:hypothetical protein|nr:hypothetical protein [Pseudomonadota bacterium]